VGNAIFSRFDITDITTQKIGNDQFGDRNLLCARLAEHPHLRLCSTHLTPADTTARVQLELTDAIPATCSGACSDHRAEAGQVKLRVRVGPSYAATKQDMQNVYGVD
jgi:hypothetical protein